MKKALNTFLFCLTCNFGFSQWTSQSPVLPEKQGLYDLQMSPFDNQVVWSICNKYTVQNTTFTQSQNSVILMITRSNDGGETWNGVTTPSGTNLFASNISPVSDSIAWISLINGGASFENYIYKTTDGGATWEQQLQNGFPTGIGYVNLVFFWDSQIGIAMGDPTNYQGSANPFFEIWRTVDGGQNWVRIPESEIPAPISSSEYGWSGHGSYDAIGQTIWFETMNGANFPTVLGSRLFRSKDAGQTWEAFNFEGLYGISFADSLNGIALEGNPWVGEGQTNTPIYRTTDGGETWQQSGEINGQMTTSAELVPNSLAIIATTRENNFGPYTTQVSHDWGQTWIQLGVTDEFVAGLTFSNPSVGYGGDWQRASNKPFNMYKYSGSPITGIISNKKIEANVDINPNPATDKVNIEITLPQPGQFAILLNDQKGRLLAKRQFENNGTFTIDLTGYPAGVYLLTLSTKGGFLTRTILKK
jgi:photosystem II stability/assembly factor-like uncharacterized protein